MKAPKIRIQLIGYYKKKPNKNVPIKGLYKDVKATKKNFSSYKFGSMNVKSISFPKMPRSAVITGFAFYVNGILVGGGSLNLSINGGEWSTMVYPEFESGALITELQA